MSKSQRFHVYSRHQGSRPWPTGSPQRSAHDGFTSLSRKDEERTHVAERRHCCIRSVKTDLNQGGLGQSIVVVESEMHDIVPSDPSQGTVTVMS